MEDKQFIDSLQMINESVHPTLRVGDTVCSIRHNWNKDIEVIVVGEIKKINRRSLAVEVSSCEPNSGSGTFTFTGRYNSYGNLVFPNSARVLYGFSLGYHDLWVIRNRDTLGADAVAELVSEIHLRFRTSAEANAAAAKEAARKRQEEQESAERKRLDAIEAYWESEGRAIWESRQIHSLPLPFEMHVLTRRAMVRTDSSGREYLVNAKVATCIMTISDDQFDWKAAAAGRQPRQIVEIAVSGFEMLEYKEGTKPSSFSSSTYSYEHGSDYQKQFVYELFGGW